MIASQSWSWHKGSLVCSADRRITVCNAAGRPDASIAAELAAIHNRQVRALVDDCHALALENASLHQRIAQAEETRTAAQAEATRQLLGRREFADAVRRALRIGAGGNAVAAIYRLQWLADAVRAIRRAEGQS